MTGEGDARSERPSVVQVQRLSEAERVAVTDLAAAAEAADGVGPLDDQVRSEIEYGANPDSFHLLAGSSKPADVVGYAHAAREEAGLSGHLVVHPGHRRRGVGRTLLDDLVVRLGKASVAVPELRVWAHGDTAGAQALAAAAGLHRVRDLIQMRLPLDELGQPPSYPADVTVRTFEPGVDDAAWLALNARAFAKHPEQGRLTQDDLEHRIAQPWFDADGFFLAVRGDRLVGSHWTKVHPAEETGGDPVGEVYAVGIDPDAQGLGLGKALTLTGLEHLRSRGLREVMLYVDGDNPHAVRLYEGLGFATARVDVMYSTSAAGE